MKNLQILERLKYYGIKPNKKFGQNFLLDETVLHDIVDAAELTKDDVVIEVGPGIGNLTELLLEKAGYVVSVEKDESLFPVLKDLKDKHSNFYFDLADALHTNPLDLFEAAKKKNKSFANADTTKYKVVANIPYYVTGLPSMTGTFAEKIMELSKTLILGKLS